MPAPGAVDDADPDIELQNSLPDVWSVRIFVALCRKHRVRPYRYPRQRRTTLIVRTRQISFERTVATEFRALYRESTANFDETVKHLISDAMKSDGDDQTLERRQLPRYHTEPIRRPGRGRRGLFRANPSQRCVRRQSWTTSPRAIRHHHVMLYSGILM